MSSKSPTHVAYVIQEPGRGRKAVWHRVGSVFPHDKGDGFDLVIPPGLSVSGRIVAVKPKLAAEASAEDDAADEALA